MKFSTTLVAAFSVVLPLVSSHVVLNDPLPFNGDQDNAPLAADGSNFPCKLTGAASGTSSKTFTPGTPDTFILKGSAVHGGGSCQISVTYDNPPTKNSVFKVVQSYEGACPVSAVGNLPADPNNLLPSLPVTMPTGLKSGDAVFVWTWFNKIGNREMYMNCAPITIGGSESSDTVFKSLPDMFVANIPTAPNNECTTKETFDIQFPNPGQNVVTSNAGTNFAPACGDAASGSGSSGSGSGQYSSSAAAAPSSTPNVSTQPALVGGGQSATSVGTVYTPINSGIATTATTMTTFQTVISSAPSVPTYNPPVVATSAPAATTAPAAAAPTSGSSGSTSGSSNGSEASAMGTCDPTKGTIICKADDPTMFAQCYESGVMWGYFAVPPGTKCDQEKGYFVSETSGSYSRLARRQTKAHMKRSHAHRLN